MLTGSIEQRLTDVRARIASAGGDPERITIVAVSKGVDASAVRAAIGAGLRDAGENYAQELLAKAADTGAAVRWHFLGRLQRNKVKSIAPIVAVWQSVDRLAAGQVIARHAPGATVLVQVNTTGEASKGGCRPADAPALVDQLRAVGLAVGGLMTIGLTGPPEAARAGFAALRELADRLELPERSMGMTADLEVAVAEGATIVRVGTALFGPRPAADDLRR